MYQQLPLKNIRASAMSGDSRFLSAVVLPAVENNISVGADVAGIASTFLAMAWSELKEAPK